MTKPTKYKDTSWEKVANWYDGYLKQGEAKGNSLYQSVVVPRLRQLLKKFHKKDSDNLLLDAACGQGIVSRLAGELGYKVTAFDKSKSLVEIAKKIPTKGKIIEYLVADAREADLKFTGRTFDLITCILALQNIPEADLAVKSFSKLLNREGKLLLVVNHPAFRIPRQSDWGWDEKSKLQFRRVNIYHSELSIPISSRPFKSKFGNRSDRRFDGKYKDKYADKNVGKNEVTWSYHRPLTYYFDSLASAGLKVESLEEWYSERASEPGPKAKAENRARSEFPLFLCLVASR